MISGKKGQLGKLVISFPILLLVFVIMGLFVAISITLSVAKSGESANFLYRGMNADDLMLKNVNVEIDVAGSKTVKEMLVLDAIVKFKNNEITQEALCNSLKQIIPNGLGLEKTLFIFSGTSENPSWPENLGFIKKVLSKAPLIKAKARVNPADCYIGAGSGPAGYWYATVSPNVDSAIFVKYRNLGSVRSTSFVIGGQRIYLDYYYGGRI